MKFLSKRPDSAILAANLTYREKAAVNNQRLRDALLAEQKNFCAYTEKYIQELDSVEVEHFNANIKYQDDYHNYYAVIRAANQYKKDEAYRGASFFENRFYQNKEQFDSRIQFIEWGYEELKAEDEEAKKFIDFLGLNNERLFTNRKRFVERIKRSFEEGGFSKEQQLEYFRNNKEELCFVTALEAALEINLSEFYS